MCQKAMWIAKDLASGRTWLWQSLGLLCWLLSFQKTIAKQCLSNYAAKQDNFTSVQSSGQLGKTFTLPERCEGPLVEDKQLF